MTFFEIKMAGFRTHCPHMFEVHRAEWPSDIIRDMFAQMERQSKNHLELQL